MLVNIGACFEELVFTRKVMMDDKVSRKQVIGS
jgi:hypothetical protein